MIASQYLIANLSMSNFLCGNISAFGTVRWMSTYGRSEMCCRLYVQVKRGRINGRIEAGFCSLD